MLLDFNSCSVMLTDGADIVSLQTDYRCSFSKDFLPSQPPLEVEFECSHDTGIDYCQEVFGVQPTIKNIRG